LDSKRHMVGEFYACPRRLRKLSCVFVMEVSMRLQDPERFDVPSYVQNRYTQVQANLLDGFLLEEINSWQLETIMAIVKLALCDDKEIYRVIKEDFQYTVGVKGFPKMFMKAVNILMGTPACDEYRRA
jgi:hypothetical protein